MNRKVLLALGAVAVVAGGGALIWQLGRPSETQSVVVSKSVRPPGPTPTIVPGPDRPTATPSAGVETSVPSATDDIREVRRGDMVIHDHRDNPTAAMDPTPVIRTPGGRLLPANVANELAAVLRPGINACTEAIPKEARGAAARIDAHLTVAIKAGKLSVTAVDQPVVGDIKGDAATSVRDCLKNALATAALTTAEPDIADYPISLSMPLTKI